MSEADAARSELRLLVEALSAHAEWQLVTGAFGCEPALATAPALAAAPAPAPVPSARPEPVRAPSSLAVEPPRSLAPSAQSAPRPAVEPRVAPQPGSAAAPPHAALPAIARSPDAARARLEVLAAEVKSCTRCGLHEARTQAVFARGNGSSGVCFVGEGPGADEDAQGLPFVGAAGQLLDRMIAAMGIQREDVYVCNIVKCRPPKNRTPEPDEIAACMPYLAEQLDLIEPRVIVALGKTAVQGLFGTAEGITKMRGRWRLYRGRIAVMPTFHPAYLLRNPAAKREVWADLQAVMKQLGKP